MNARRLAVALFAGLTAGAALAGAPDRSIRPMPRPVPQEAAQEPAIAAALTSALAVLASPRPLPRPREVVVSAAPSAPVTVSARPVVPRTVAARTAPVDPIAAFFQGLTAPKPAAVAAAAPSTLAVPRSPRPETRPSGFAKLISAITAPRATSRAGSVCGVAEIKGQALRRIDGAGACGVDKPVRVTSVSGVAVAGGPTIDCTTAKALNNWVRTGVMPAVGRTGGGVAQVNVIAHYACRTRNNARGAKLSEHALGHAVDVSGVTLKDGTTLTVLDHWRSGSYGKIVKAMHGSACGTFGTVLGPNADRYHQDHFHLDTARYRSGSYCR